MNRDERAEQWLLDRGAILGFQPATKSKAQIEAEQAKIDALFDPDLQQRRRHQVAEASRASMHRTMRPVPAPVSGAAPRRGD